MDGGTDPRPTRSFYNIGKGWRRIHNCEQYMVAVNGEKSCVVCYQDDAAALEAEIVGLHHRIRELEKKVPKPYCSLCNDFHEEMP